jgi:YidC/Oxa1 family membrane protein insertase
VYREIRGQEKVYGLKEKTIVRYGYSLIDHMIADYERQGALENDPKVILIAPSWQEDNIMDSCIETILEKLLGKGYHVILRPHPQYVRHFEDRLKAMEEAYAAQKDFTLQMDFSSNDTVFNADILITDWSGIAYEYSFTTLKPTLFIDTPMKVMNPDYQDIDVEPFDVVIRNEIGISLKPEELDAIGEVVQKLLYHPTYSREHMKEIRSQYLYNVGNSGEVGADYIIRRLIAYSKGEK